MCIRDRDSIEYILQEGKTENGKYVFGNSGYTPQMIYNTFLATKSLYGKTEGRQAYHYILTFAEEDSVTPELAQEITEKFMSRLFPEDEYDWVGGVHTDTEHLHAHILFNSVNRNTGYKYRYEKGDWEKTIQKIVDDLCHELGLATIAYELLWSSVFVTLMAKKYRFMQFELEMCIRDRLMTVATQALVNGWVLIPQKHPKPMQRKT